MNEEKKVNKDKIVSYTASPNLKPKKSIVKYVAIGVVVGIVVALGYYFIDYQDTLETKIEEPIVIGISKDKVLLADKKEYELDIVLNSIVNNQFVLQESIKVMDERIDLIIKEREQENAKDNNQGE